MKLIKLPKIKSCGNQQRGCSWAGATVLITPIKVNASIQKAA